MVADRLAERLSRWSLATTGCAVLLVVLMLPDPALAQDPPWQADLLVDQELSAFEDPTLLRVLTLEPNSDKRLRGSQPFKQQPLFSQQDFRPPIDPVVSSCVPVAGKACR